MSQVRILVGVLLMLSALGHLCAQVAGQQDQSALRPRQIPSHALIRPGVDNEKLTKANPMQRFWFGGEILHASVRQWLSNPFKQSAQIVGRGAERITNRNKVFWQSTADHQKISARELERYERVLSLPQYDARVTLLVDGQSSFNELVRLIDHAQFQIDLMMYAWEDDPTGREMVAALVRAGKRGVQVRVMVDRASFLIHNPSAVSKPSFIDDLQGIAGVEVIQPRGAMLRFDHRKLAIIDQKVAWTGGMIFTHPARTEWDMLSLLAEGPVVNPLRQEFSARWHAVGGLLPDCVSPNGPTDLIMTNTRAQLLKTDERERSLRDAIYSVVDHARTRIWLENCYFTDDMLIEKLGAAAQRGVDVRVITTMRGNIKVLNHYMALTTNRLLKLGVRVYLSPGMSHIKAMTVDSQWAYIGSANFDELGFRNNTELGLALLGPVIAQSIDQALFEPHMLKAEEVRKLVPIPPHHHLLRLVRGWL